MNQRKLLTKRLLDRVGQMVLVFMVALFAYESIAVGIGARTKIVADARIYYDIAIQFSFWSNQFWHAMKPIGVPLVYKLVGGSVDGYIAFQVVVHLVAWAGFAVYLFMRLRSRLVGLLLAAYVLAMALMPEVVIWNYSGLSESLTFSFLPLISILLLEIVRRPNRFAFIGLMVALAYFSTLRDTNAYFVLTMALLFCALYFGKAIGRRDLVCGVSVVIACFIYSSYSADHAGPSTTYKRWFSPILNNISQRVLYKEDMLAHMEHRGMPTSSALLRKKGVWATHRDSVGFSFYSDPELVEFREFVAGSGKDAYSEYLVRHPGYVLGEVWSNRNTVFHVYDSITPKYYQDGVSVDHVLPFSKIENVWFYSSLSVFCILALVAIARTGRLNLWCLAALSVPIAGSFLVALVAYHGDAMEVPRHTLLVPAILKVSLVTITFVLFEELERQRPGSRVTEGNPGS